ncbi:high affinity immunoglobulin epsilon receptor subunit beta-like [Octodon degus]|uniref:high affinity immunoglobulin epsilon receptor subunit beta-like n=1 Tax=Octodon degus TaxID=10160 RepID=UPI000C9FF8E4|nr:high affinity immunoglobulin epsilon receptor subunit beta-like [Octodon degus]
MSAVTGSRGITADIPPRQSQNTQIGYADTCSSTQHPHGKLHRFIQNHLQLLGATQIMIGLKCFLLGIIEAAFTLNPFCKSISFSFYVGFPFWATVSFVLSGTLTVSSTKTHTKFLVGVSIAANITSTVLSIIGLSLLFLNLIDIFLFDCTSSECSLAKSLTTSTMVLQAMVTCIQLAISFTLSVFTYHVDGSDMSGVSALSCFVKSASEDPYQDLLSPPEPYEDITMQGRHSDNYDP